MDVREKCTRLEAAVEAYRRQQAARATASKSGGEGAAEGGPPESVAIVGLSGYLPQCMSVGEFWRALDEDRSLVEEIPETRFDWRSVYSPGGAGRSQTKWGGFIPDVRGFDPAAFGIVPDEADLMDPQQRMLLMAAYNTFEDAGHAPSASRKRRTGVFIAFERNEYLLNLQDAGVDTGIGLAAADSMLANRLSYAFDLDGPSEIVNTMCSGGAVAIHRAVAALRSGEIDSALAGAANIILRPDVFIALSRTGQMSPVATVKSFGANARGYLRGEGVCTVLLKRLAQAQADGDAVYAVIRNTAVNYNGRGGTSIAAPSAARHSELIQRCYRAAGIAPEHVTYIEAQGMGNPAADIAEWDAFNHALQAVARERGVSLPDGSCVVSTLKPMTGHMHAASALGSLLKVIRSFHAGLIYRIAGFTEPDPYLRTDGVPCRLAVETHRWPPGGRPRLAGIHSYGAGGTNAHLLLEEYNDDRPRARGETPMVIPVAARTPELLVRQVAALAAHLTEHPEHSLAEVAFTMQAGRDAHPAKVAFVAESRERWLDQARTFLNGADAAGVCASAAAGHSSGLGGGGTDLQTVAARWVAGAAVEWPVPPQPVRRLHLPVSAFDVAAHWIDGGAHGREHDRAYRATPVVSDRTSNAPVVGALTPDAAQSLVLGALGDALRVPDASVHLETQFSDSGFDSFMVLGLCSRMKARGGIVMEPAVLFEHRTPRSLIQYLAAPRDVPAAAIGQSGCDAASSDGVTSRATSLGSRVEREPIAIIGMSGTYPKARDLDELWANLLGGRDCIGEIPPDRWSVGEHYEPDEDRAVRSGKSYGRWGGFVEDVNGFDAMFFHVSPAEAEYMHPKERMFMQCAWQTLEDAGYTPGTLAEERVGVYVGVSKAGFDNYRDSFFSLPNRISYRFNFTGPSLPIDTACSSSLSAMHEACLHLQAGECTVALAGGVNVYTHPSAFVEFSRLGVMSRDGRSRAFGTDANGFVPGEGVGAVLLKPVRRAVADGDQIHAVIRGTAINHGGKVNGYTVPNPRAHRDVIRLALERAGVAAGAISYVEGHGTGTVLGDPVEVRGLTEAFASHTRGPGFCRLGSIKTNIGHLEAAAGVAGLTKVVLQLKHRRLVASLHAAVPNPNIDFAQTPFVLQQRSEDWPPTIVDGLEVPRLACVSSFGAGGSNAHIVVEEHVPDASTKVPSVDAGTSETLVVLSARSASALRSMVESLAACIDRRPALDLADLAYTLQVGREQMAHRLACIAGSVSALLDALKQFLAEGRALGLLSGQARRTGRISAFKEDEQAAALVHSWFEQKKFTYLAELWVSGEDIDWPRLYAERRPKRISLPCYPFDQEYVRPAELLLPKGAARPPAPVDREDAADGGGRGMLLLRPAWREVFVPALSPDSRDGTWRLILCDLLPDAGNPRCRTLRSSEPDIAARYESYLLGLFHEVHALITDERREPTFVQVAVPATGESRLLAGLTGFLKSAQLECSRVRGQLVEVDPEVSASELMTVLAEARAVPEHAWIRQAGRSRYAMEWEEYVPEARASGDSFSEGGRYLITGGAGGLGQIFADDIAERVPHATLVLVGRSPLDPARSRKLDALTTRGARVIYRQVDVADGRAVVDLMASVRAELGGLDGIVHCAGVTRDAYILKKRPADMAAVLGPKVRGTVNLDRASAGFNLQFFVMFSSAAGAIGYASQADYAAASAFMDAYARQRNERVREGRRSGRTLSLDWGLWQDGGMTVSAEVQKLLWNDSGMVPMSRAAGLRAFHQGLASGLDQLLAIEGSVERLKTHLLSPVVSAAGAPAAPDGSLGSLPALDAVVARLAAEALGVDEKDVDLDVDYTELAIDRGAFTAVVTTLNDRYGLDLQPDLFRQHRNLRALSKAIGHGRSRALLHGDVSAAGSGVSGGPKDAASAVDEDSVRQRVLDYVKTCVATVTRLPSSRMGADVPLEHFGIDSLMVLQITAALEQAFGRLPKTLLYQYQTVGEIADYLARAGRDSTKSLLASPAVTPPAAVPRTQPAGAMPAPHVQHRAAPRVEADAPAAVRPLDIAIVGVAGRYPKARTLRELWKVLREGCDCITEIPDGRWDHSRYYDEDRAKPGKTYAKWGGFLDGVDEFDAAFFNISPREAATMEPQERLFLEVAYEALEDAGYTRQALRRQSVLDGLEGSVGTFVGVTYEEYQLYGAEETARGRPMVLSMSPASIANRVSYFCNFHGPSMSVDTMCASSLTTIHLACQSLRNKECRAAIAGGVNVSIHPAKYLMLGYGNFASPLGRCQAFGEGADGFVPSEGVGAVLLKALELALADGDQIYGVIKGSAINHGGKTNGYPVPNPKAQTAVVEQALRQSGVNARAISYLEAHGTGTALGDPIEIAALNRAFGACTSDEGFCALGSVKSNVGHCESAAGVVGLTKVLLQMKHRTLVPTLHARTKNPHIDFAHSPFVVQQVLAEWRPPVFDVNGSRRTYPRIAGVSSFGAGGSNAHLVVEEAPLPERSSEAGAVESGTPVLVVLSARTGRQLQEQAERLLESVRDGDYADGDLIDMAYTLQVGREAMDERLGFIVTSIESLRQKLIAFLDGSGCDGVFHGRAADLDENRGLDCSSLLQRWMRGLPIAWEGMYTGRQPRRISLPTYPFERRRYWLPEACSRSNAPGDAPSTRDTKDARGAEHGRPARKVVLTPVAAIQPPHASVRELVRTPVEVGPLIDPPPGGLRTPAPPHGAVAAVPGRDCDAFDAQLTAMLAESLSLDPASVDVDRCFSDLGLDSIVGVEWIRAVNERFETRVAANAVYVYPSIRAFAGHLRDVLAAAAIEPAAPDVAAARQAFASHVTASITSDCRDPDVLDWLRVSLAAALDMEPQAIKANQNFLDIGLDSIVGVEWIRQVNQRFGIAVEADAVYRYPNLQSFSAMVGSAYSASQGPSPPTSLDDLLEQVHRGTIDIDTAEKALRDFVR